ncbi:MAG: ATP-binding protein [Bacteroidetes bacterium]|jgi:uncharacterized protein|nr:ATP-binding protein [Bacteroidota bacterium]MBT6685742.1 ATP-binding protein [Bacteroidota bacterium]MBT7143038.1 ATP-binding protein [Bacteroidota bacterium]MBT7492447.1 ATP-binding protein [Bacteroidota bacterium]
MIYEFSFGNFKSFKNINSLNLTSAKINDLDNRGTIQDHNSLLKCKAIYGANASGKSNIIIAITTFLRIIVLSVKNNEEIESVDNFRLCTETENQPTFFQLIFQLENITYRYGFEATDKKITSEWLYGKLNIREVPFFIRDQNKIIKISEKHFAEGSRRLSLFDNDDDSLIDEKSLFLTTIASLNGKKAQSISNYLSRIIIVPGLKDMNSHELTKSILEIGTIKEKVLKLLRLADTGIEDIKLIEVSEDNLKKSIPEEIIKDLKGKKLVISEHKKYDSKKNVVHNEPFDFLFNESEGTKKIFELSPMLLLALTEGRPIIIDEFDARFHPLITKKIVELFNSDVNKTSQLIFATHDTNLLSVKLLRRDQIDFVEKDKYGESHLYTLVKFKGVRKNTSFEKDYIKGKYGAIPFLGDFNQILKTEDDA